MFVALDEKGNRVYANSVEKSVKCFCPVCNEEVKLRKGAKNKPHFAHRKDSDCLYGNNPNYKTEWHIRMQEYFPKEVCEVRFVDDETGEIHIADVFLSDSKTVLEFQHSPISGEEFLSRTLFHLKNGRRIVWLFDESSKSESSTFGKFRFVEYLCQISIPYYKWMRNPRFFLAQGPKLKEKYNQYSVCVYTGTEGDVFHRIIEERDSFQVVGFSPKSIQIKPDIDVEQFFNYDPYWMAVDEYQKALELRKKQYEQMMVRQFVYSYGCRPRRNRRF